MGNWIPTTLINGIDQQDSLKCFLSTQAADERLQTANSVGLDFHPENVVISMTIEEHQTFY